MYVEMLSRKASSLQPSAAARAGPALYSPPTSCALHGTPSHSSSSRATVATSSCSSAQQQQRQHRGRGDVLRCRGFLGTLFNRYACACVRSQRPRIMHMVRVSWRACAAHGLSGASGCWPGTNLGQPNRRTGQSTILAAAQQQLHRYLPYPKPCCSPLSHDAIPFLAAY